MLLDFNVNYVIGFQCELCYWISNLKFNSKNKGNNLVTTMIERKDLNLE